MASLGTIHTSHTRDTIHGLHRHHCHAAKLLIPAAACKLLCDTHNHFKNKQTRKLKDLYFSQKVVALADYFLTLLRATKKA